MNVIPIVFAFDNRVVMPAGVCFTSLLKSAHHDTFYHIHIMHGDDELKEVHMNELRKLKSTFSNFDITFINIGNMFDNVYVARGIPRLTYYKIIISDMIKYDRCLFSDVDIIFTGDLWEMFNGTDFGDNYIAGVKAAICTSYMTDIGCDLDTYINCGFLLYNLAAIRKDPSLIEKQKALCGKKWLYLDQDIVNIVYKGRFTFLPPKYNATFSFFISSGDPQGILAQKYTQQEIKEALMPVVIHYTGANPWKDFSLRHDIWWQYYRESIYFDYNYYFKHYMKLFNPTLKEGLVTFAMVVKKHGGKVYKKLLAK